MNVALERIDIEIMDYISVEFAIVMVAGIALGRTPNLTRRFRISTESGQTCRAEKGSMNSVPGPWFRAGDAVSFKNREPHAFVGQPLIDSGVIAALWQPEAVCFPAESLDVVRQADMDLRAHCPRLNREQRQVAVRRRAGQNFYLAGSLK